MHLLKRYKAALSGLCLTLTAGFFPAFGEEALHGSEGDLAYSYTSRGVMCFENADGECRVKILIDDSTLGGKEMELAEIVFPAGYEGRSHPHQSIEVFYVLDGTFGHEVNGEPAFLEPGMIGIVRPGDAVRHSVKGDRDARVLVIWVPGGEAARNFDFSKGRPIE